MGRRTRQGNEEENRKELVNEILQSKPFISLTTLMGSAKIAPFIWQSI